MAQRILIESAPESRVEMVERKGAGHPDTVCDSIAEAVSLALCRYYLREFGAVLHHNVDKALLVGGQSEPRFGGGRMVEPIELILAGRATRRVGMQEVPVDDITIEAARNWLKSHFRYLDPDKNVRIVPRIRPGSSDLVDLFTRFGRGETPLANDTSFGMGYYPLTATEQTLIDINNWLEAPETRAGMPFIGEDVKVMGVDDGDQPRFTVAIAMVDRFLENPAAYQSAIRMIRRGLATALSLPEERIAINTADDYAADSYYLTVTGTSAEGGDDGQVGRGNRANGLITPYRPMSLEALAGKNPVSHVGKIYNLFAPALARELVEAQLAEAVQVFIVSQIGQPIDQPQLLHLRLKNPAATDEAIRAFAAGQLITLREYWKKVVV